MAVSWLPLSKNAILLSNRTVEPQPDNISNKIINSTRATNNLASKATHKAVTRQPTLHVATAKLVQATLALLRTSVTDRESSHENRCVTVRRQLERINPSAADAAKQDIRSMRASPSTTSMVTLWSDKTLTFTLDARNRRGASLQLARSTPFNKQAPRRRI